MERKNALEKEMSPKETKGCMTSGQYVLRTEGLTKIYGGRRAVDSVSMHVRKGDIYGFIGKNGAGKTTFMRMVAGLARPDAGEMELFGSRDIERQRMRIGTLIELPRQIFHREYAGSVRDFQCFLIQIIHRRL